MFTPAVIDPLLISGKMFDHIIICFRTYRYHPAQGSFRTKSGQQGTELIPADRFKLFRPYTQPVLRHETGNDQVPVFKQVVVRVSALPGSHLL